MKKLILALLLVPGIAGAVVSGKLDLSPTVQALVLRDANDGQWLAGTAHYLWLLKHNENTILHLGIFNAFNAESGNGSFGPLFGLDLMGASKDIGLDIPATISLIGDWSGIPSVFKPAAYFSSLLSIDAFGGYRPIHTSDVNGPWIYGGAAALKIPFGVKELQQGL